MEGKRAGPKTLGKQKLEIGRGGWREGGAGGTRKSPFTQEREIFLTKFRNQNL